MTRTGSPYARLSMLCGAILLAFAGCATDPVASDGATGSLSLDLTVAGDYEIDEVAWTIRGGEMPDMSGAIDTSAPGSTASVEVFGIPQGTGYTIDMQATSTDGELTCAGSTQFDVGVDVATDVHVMLNCEKPARFGAVRVDGKLNLCAELTKAVVSPLQTSVGSSIDLQSEAVDEEGDEVEYLWTAESGQVDDPTAANTAYTCTEAGDDQITITVSDDGFDYCSGHWTVPVTCVETVQYSYETFDLPDAGSVLLNGLNSRGDLVGQATFPPNQPTAQGFVSPNGGTPDFFDPPGSEATAVIDINDDGIAVGWSFQDPTFLFVSPYVRDASGAISTPDLTALIDAEDIEFNGINNQGQIVGGALDFAFPSFDTTASAFVIDAADPSNIQLSEVSLIDLPGVENEFAWDINELGTIVGSASESGVTRGFLLDSDRLTFRLFDIQGASLTRPQAINDLGQVVGLYRLEETGTESFSFLLNPDGTWVHLAVPGADSTWARGINDEGTIVGQYSAAGRSFGFVATVVPPDSDEDPEVEFVYSELTADGLAIRYLLDANDEGQMVGSVPSNPPGSLDGFLRAPDGSAQFWTTPDRLAYPTAINDGGRIVGTNIPIGGGLPEGFQRDTEGNETPYNFPGALGTVPFGISNDDTYTGFYVTSEGRRGFVEQPSSGLSRSVEFPGATETQLYGVNNVGKAGGAHYDSAGVAYPFIYDIASDSFEEITPPTSGNYGVPSKNDAGDAIVFGLRDISENYADLRSFYRDGDTGVMTELFYPGASETYGYDIDDEGTIIGYFLDESGGYGGFSAVIAP